MTETVDTARVLVPQVEEGMPEGVLMWVLEAGTGLPADSPVNCARFTVEPGAATDVDLHDVVEVWTVTAGSGTVEYGGQSTEIGVGQSIFFPSRVDHRMVNTTEAPVEVFSFWWRRDPA